MDTALYTHKLHKKAQNLKILPNRNDPYDSLLGIKFTLRNIPTIIDYTGIADLKDVFKGKPGIVISSHSNVANLRKTIIFSPGKFA